LLLSSSLLKTFRWFPTPSLLLKQTISFKKRPSLRCQNEFADLSISIEDVYSLGDTIKNRRWLKRNCESEMFFSTVTRIPPVQLNHFQYDSVLKKLIKLTKFSSMLRNNGFKKL
jgi:hypothetical protein